MIHFRFIFCCLSIMVVAACGGGGEDTPAAPEIVTFSKTFEAPGRNYARSVRQTEDGGYIIAGMTESIGAGSADAYLIKLNAKGDLQWEKTFGGSGYDWSSSVRQTPDGGFIIVGGREVIDTEVGGPSQKIYLIKTNTSGEPEWEKMYGSGASGYAIEQTADGGFIIAGMDRALGRLEGVVYLVRVDSQGNLIWDRRINSGNLAKGLSVRQTSDGGFIVAGEIATSIDGDSNGILIRLDENGYVSWERTFDDLSHQSVLQTGDDGFLVVGIRPLGGPSVNLFKTDADGRVEWEKVIAAYARAYSIEPTMDGGYITAGNKDATEGSRSAIAAHLIKVDESGAVEWEKAYGPVKEGCNSGGRSALQTNEGGFILAGLQVCPAEGTSGGITTVFIVKTDNLGNLQ